MNIAKAVLQARRRTGLSQRELSERSGVPQPTIARIESGIVDPRVSTVVKLLDACDESLEVLPRLGTGVDRSLIRSTLSLTPRERLERATAVAHGIDALVKATRAR